MKILPIKTELTPLNGKLTVLSLYDYNHVEKQYFFPHDILLDNVEKFLKGQYVSTLLPMAVDTMNYLFGITTCERTWAELTGNNASQEIWCYYITGVYVCYNETKMQNNILNRMLQNLLLRFKIGWDTNDRHHFTYIAFKADYSFVSKMMMAMPNIWQIQRYNKTDLYYINIADVIEDDMFNLDFIKHLCLHNTLLGGQQIYRYQNGNQ